MRSQHVLLSISYLALGLSTAHATPVTFFGEDINSGGDAGRNRLTSYPHADNARTQFFNNLVGVGTEDFESIPVGTNNPVITFPGAGTALLTGSGDVASGVSPTFQYATSGSRYYNAGTGDFGVTFSDPVAAFGFYGVDIGDFGGRLNLKLTAVGGTISTLTVPNRIGSGGNTGGSVLYFAFYDTAQLYTAITFDHTNGVENFGFDDFSIGSLSQVTPMPNVPIPASAPMFGAALVLLATAGYAAKRTKATVA